MTEAASKSRTAIIILNWNGWRDTIECLDSVFRSTHPDFQVIVCDNASSNRSVERIREWADGRAVSSDSAEAEHYSPPLPRPIQSVQLTADQLDRAPAAAGADFVLLETGGNLGFAGGVNIGIQFALRQGGFEYIWLLNNDTVVAPPALSSMIAAAERSPRAAGIGSKVMEYHHPETIQVLGGGAIVPWKGMTRQIGRGEVDRGQWSEQLDLDYITGSSMLVRAEAFRTVGLLDEQYFLYAEEVDWCLRARRAGWDLTVTPDSVVWHKEGNTTGRKSPLTDYYSLRGILLFTRKFYPALLPFVVAHSVFRCLLPKLVRLHFRRARAVLLAYRDVLGAPSAAQGYRRHPALKRR